MIIDQEKIDNLKANQPIDFSDALEVLKYGLKVKRTGWKVSKLEFIKLKKPTLTNDGSRRDAIFTDYLGDEHVLTTEDILAEDWIIVE